MFASTVIDYRYVYVYGGIERSEPYMNTMASTVCERYDSHQNIWTPFEVQNSYNLSSFGWCQGENSGVLYIVGGSDGCVL